MRLKRRNSGFPTLNTAALPDLIFTVLFFFMIVTHMRSTDVKVKYTVPQGTELSKVQHKSAITYLYIGKDAKGNTQLQLNDQVVTMAELPTALEEAREDLSPDDEEYQTVSIKADRDTPLDVIAKVKAAISYANTLNVSYGATETKSLNHKP